MKKCSTPKTLRGPRQWSGIPFAIALSISLSSHALANPESASSDKILKNLTQDLQRIQAPAFDHWLKEWSTRYGTQAVAPLLQLAQTTSFEDPKRYIALMGAAKLGGTESAPLFKSFLKDKSWMLRAGALRAMKALKHPKTAEDVLPLLKDPALVVRREAVEAIEVLQPAGSPEALLQAIFDESNYHAGKALWVPQRALQALAQLQIKEAAPRIRPLLDRKDDPALQQEAARTLQALAAKENESF